MFYSSASAIKQCTVIKPTTTGGSPPMTAVARGVRDKFCYQKPNSLSIRTRAGGANDRPADSVPLLLNSRRISINGSGMETTSDGDRTPMSISYCRRENTGGTKKPNTKCIVAIIQNKAVRFAFHFV